MLIDHAVTEGNICEQYSVTVSGHPAKKWPKFLGDFKVTDDLFNGRPVYANTRRKVLHVGNDGRWCISHKVQNYCKQVTSVNKPTLPDLVTSWQYRFASKNKAADVTVKCNKQCNIHSI